MLPLLPPPPCPTLPPKMMTTLSSSLQADSITPLLARFLVPAPWLG